MGSPVNVSEILANLPGGNSDDEPDWLKELEEGDDGKEVRLLILLYQALDT